LNYKWSQDHCELLNAAIRGRCGKNTNPDVLQFKSALKKLLLHASVTASKYSNCLAFDSDVVSPIFSLKWTKNRSAMSEEEDPMDDDHSTMDLNLLDNFAVSENKEAILTYIGGSIVRKLCKAIDCAQCREAMMADDITKRNYSLISLKDNGGLVYPSDDVVTILIVCEKYFHCHVRGVDGHGMNSSKKLQATLFRDIVRELSTTRPGKILFTSLLQHDLDTHSMTEDYHSTQVMKAIIKSFLKMRLLRYAQQHTMDVVSAGKLGKRHQLNKLVLFNGL
jgi:hypothetical protein